MEIFYLLELTKESFKPIETNKTLQKATLNDKEELLLLILDCNGESEPNEEFRYNFGKHLESSKSNIYFIRENKKIVSTISIISKNSVNCLLTCICTDENYRNKGYASTCVSESCKKIINENKKIIIFYNNADAGRMYKKIGFVDVGRWSIGHVGIKKN